MLLSYTRFHTMERNVFWKVKTRLHTCIVDRSGCTHVVDICRAAMSSVTHMDERLRAALPRALTVTALMQPSSF